MGNALVFNLIHTVKSIRVHYIIQPDDALELYSLTTNKQRQNGKRSNEI